MKYAIVIPDGCADEPQESLGGRTPLQAAHKPHMDALARAGVVGRSNNVPQPLTPASDVATLSLFGYDPLHVYTGRAPLEAAAMNLPLGPGDWAIRCNLVAVENGQMRDFTAGHIDSADGRQLIEALDRTLGGVVEGGRLEFHAGVSYRNLLVFRAEPPLTPTPLPAGERGRGEGAAPFSADTVTQPPHDIPDRPIADHLPRGPGGDLLRRLMERSRPVLAEHPVNAARQAAGKRPATQIWLWGQGKAPSLRSFAEVYRRRGAIISAVDLVRGVGVLIGWQRIDVAGATGYLDTDYAAKGRAAVEALGKYDLVCVHVEAPDEASHEGNAEAKVKALEEIDRHIVGPLCEALPRHGDWRLLVSPDHRTPLRTRVHAYGPVPFVVAGTNIRSRGQASYDEVVAERSGWSFEKGHTLMPWFLK